jgi:hypothetical protein
MKRSLIVVLMALVLLSSAAVAHAAPSTQTAPIHSLSVQLPGNHKQNLGPLYSRCDSVTWIKETGPRENFPNYVLQANLYVLVDYYLHSYYCGEVQSEGLPRLLHGCVTFYGDAESSYTLDGYSNWSSYHCTATLYDYYGSVQFAPCPVGSGSVLRAFNWVSVLGVFQNEADSPLFTC